MSTDKYQKPAQIEELTVSSSMTLWAGTIIILAYAVLVWWPRGEPAASELVEEDPVDRTGHRIMVAFHADVTEPLKGKVAFQVENFTMFAHRIGTSSKNLYSVTNISDEVLYVRPIHKVTPNEAYFDFQMIECFCFNDMILQPGERRELVLRFDFNSTMTERITAATVKYELRAIAADEVKVDGTIHDLKPPKIKLGS